MTKIHNYDEKCGSNVNKSRVFFNTLREVVKPLRFFGQDQIRCEHTRLEDPFSFDSTTNLVPIARAFSVSGDRNKNREPEPENAFEFNIGF